MRKLIGPLLGSLAVAATAGLAAYAASPAPRPAESVAARPTSTARPAPHVLPFARGLRATPQRPGQRRASAPFAAGQDGCDHDYGAVDICVPWTFPASVGTAPGARCAWLLSHGFTALTVGGKDRLGLDTNHDGIACDRGDAGVAAGRS